MRIMEDAVDRVESLQVPVSLPRGRLDVWLHQQYPCVSRSHLQRLIESGAILVSGHSVKPTHRPRAGETVLVRWPVARPPTIEPRSIPLAVLYEDRWLLVLDKPEGMVVHPAAGNEDDTMVNALLHHCQGQLSGIGGVARPGIVHRLDQHTSGVLVVAKDDATHVALSRQFAERSVDKRYHALVCGRLEPPDGEIDAAIARHPNHRKVMTVLAGGRSARTTYRTLEPLEAATLVEARLHTGRTHQLRVHFKYIGFPLVGDEVYGSRANTQLAARTDFRAPRQMLHARSLSFTHPHRSTRMRFTAPWPPDFREAHRVLGGRYHPADDVDRDRVVEQDRIAY